MFDSMDPKLRKMVAALKDIFKNCTLCPRACRVNRSQREVGYCRLGIKIVMDSAFAHHGEEAPISGTNGAGTIFFSSCNLGCVYCQNYEISHQAIGQLLDCETLAEIMLHLQRCGCHNVEPVTPTPQVPLIMEALLLARERGLQIPLVYNCGGYEDPQIIKMLDKMVDIYLPDFKYGREEDGLVLSGIRYYPQFALASLREMARQVGDGLELKQGVAVKGIIVRHLVLPGKWENSRDIFRLIKQYISTAITISIMSQYAPTIKVKNHPSLSRRLASADYERVVNFALDLGFSNLMVQEFNGRDFFNRDNIFD